MFKHLLLIYHFRVLTGSLYCVLCRWDHVCPERSLERNRIWGSVETQRGNEVSHLWETWQTISQSILTDSVMLHWLSSFPAQAKGRKEESTHTHAHTTMCWPVNLNCASLSAINKKYKWLNINLFLINILIFLSFSLSSWRLWEQKQILLIILNSHNRNASHQERYTGSTGWQLDRAVSVATKAALKKKKERKRRKAKSPPCCFCSSSHCTSLTGWDWRTGSNGAESTGMHWDFFTVSQRCVCVFSLLCFF